MKRIKLNNKGFSLVELICAVAILGATITVLLNSFVIGTNVSKKRVKQSEATLAGKNILEAVAASSIDDFYSEDSYGKVKELLGNSVNVSLMEDNTYKIDENGEKVKGDGSFTVALENLNAGSSTMDAVVEFSRGDELDVWTDEDGNEVQSLSHGLYLINSEKIKLAQYDAMDGVVCQPYELGSNPDLLVENEIGALARSYGLDPRPMADGGELKQRDRKIRLYVTHDPAEDWTLTDDVEKPYNDDGTPNEAFEDLEHTGRYHYATVKYEYVFTFSRPFSVVAGSGTRVTNQLSWSRTYTVFPGGYEPQNKDGSISIYLMYYPVYSDKYASDEIHIYNNSIDPSNNRNIEYWIEDQENPYTIPLNTYLYCQDLYEYNESSYEYEYTTNPNKVNESIVLHFPQDYDSSANSLTDTYIYTNAGEICTNSFGVFEYINQAGAHYGVGADLTELIDSDLVRKEDKIKIYNIKVTLYKSDPDNPIIVEADDGLSVRDGAKPEYVIEGTRTN